jgi:hypothetical protein
MMNGQLISASPEAMPRRANATQQAIAVRTIQEYHCTSCHKKQESYNVRIQEQNLQTDARFHNCQTTVPRLIQAPMPIAPKSIAPTPTLQSPRTAAREQILEHPRAEQQDDPEEKGLAARSIRQGLSRRHGYRLTCCFAHWIGRCGQRRSSAIPWHQGYPTLPGTLERRLVKPGTLPVSAACTIQRIIK